MPHGNKIAIHHRVIATIADGIHPQEFALGLGHFFAGFIQQETVMQPSVHPWRASYWFALRDFVCVVYARQVFATGVNIKVIAQYFHTHRAAF